MSQQLTFDVTTPRFGLPLLFAGQAQKEFFVNEAFALSDAMLHCAIEAEATAPPSAPSDGENWLVGASAAGDWLGHDGSIACRQSGNWLFVVPRDGMQILNRATGQVMLYSGGWSMAVAPLSPTGGSVIDSEARAAIDALITALRVAGILPST